MNPIDLEIYWNRLIAIVDEAGAALKRTSFSTVVRESNDFAVVLLDQDGRLVTQSSLSVPGFIGTAPLSLQRMLQKNPSGTLESGDILFTNDPWIGTGHLPDSTMAAPLHFKGRIIAYAVTVAHLSDIGGRQWSADASEVFEEGIRFPVIKMVKAGNIDPAAMSLLETNVRLPKQVRGDINAQIAAIHIAHQRLCELLDDYGLDDICSISEAIYRVSEEAALKKIRAVPPGRYIGRVESDGWDEKVSVVAEVTVSETGIKVDFSGSSPQVAYGINETFNHTYAYTIYPFKCMLSPEIPNNDGFTRLFEIKAPEGSIVNAKFPAAVGARHLVGHILQAAIFDAMSSALPDMVMADSGTPMWTVLLRGVDTKKDKSFSSILFFNGGMGAAKDRDGLPAVSFPGNISNTPVEVAESLTPILFKAKHLAEGTGGNGASQGGLGQVVSFQSRWPDVIRASLLTERVKVPAKGLFGGQPGEVGHVMLNGVPVSEPKSMIALNEGDVLELRLPGGGGFGVPISDLS